MNTASSSITTSADWRDYLELCKPKVVALILLTAIVGMHLATREPIPLSTQLLATLGIAFSAGAAAVINHLWDRRIDAIMARTHKRPIVQGKVSIRNAIIFASCLTLLGMFILITWVNLLTAVLTFFTLIGYAVVYTIYLKRATPQNIVIGGLAGATPPLLGWTAVTGELSPHALLLVLIIFTWTPPHFWALAIFRHQDYAKAGIPMLPVTHGIRFTKLSVLLYTILLFLVTMLPYLVGMSGYIYLLTALILGVGFLYWAVRMLLSESLPIARQTFYYSISYLMLLFVSLLLDHHFL